MYIYIYIYIFIVVILCYYILYTYHIVVIYSCMISLLHHEFRTPSSQLGCDASSAPEFKNLVFDK